MGRFKDVVITTGDKWTVKQFYEMAKDGQVKFDNVIQRNYVWNNRQNSLYIHSLIVNFLPPECLANKKDGIFDMADGKQRNNAASSFIDNKFRLVNVPDVYDVDGNAYVLNGKYFKDLDPELQDKILSRPLQISIMDNATQEIVKEYFIRRNNGTPLSAARKTLAKAKSFAEIIYISQHPIFDVVYTKSARLGDDSKNVVMRSYAILHCENKSLEKKKLDPFFAQTEMEEEKITTLVSCYDTMLDIYELIKKRDQKSDKKILTKMMKKTHLVTVLPIVRYVNENNIDLDVFANWLIHFFAPIDKATINDQYNESATFGSSKVGAVETRLQVMTDDFMEFIAK